MSLTDVHTANVLAGPGDAGTTALQIMKDNDVEGRWDDKVVFITGCSSGIGIETARAMKATGARLIVLINNAGEMALQSRNLTADGFEAQFEINHLAHFLLFQLLKPVLFAASTPAFQSRVVVISSMGHRHSTVLLDDLNLAELGRYTPSVAYGDSKTASIYMAIEIERRYGAQGIGALSHHPGGIETGLQVHSEEILAAMRKPEVIQVMKNTSQGTATTVWAAVGRDWEGKGRRFLDDCQVAVEQGQPQNGVGGGHAPWIYDANAARELWTKSCVLVGIEDGQ